MTTQKAETTETDAAASANQLRKKAEELMAEVQRVKELRQHNETSNAKPVEAVDDHTANLNRES